MSQTPSPEPRPRGDAATTEFARPLIETRTVETPCCGTEMGLAFQSFIRNGRPRRGDDYSVWNLRCDGCGAWWTVGIEVRTKYQRAEHSTRYETRGRLVGAPHWTAR